MMRTTLLVSLLSAVMLVAGAGSAGASERGEIAADGVITLREVRENTLEELASSLKKLTGADVVSLVGDKESLVRYMQEHSLDSLPVASFRSATSRPSSGTDVSRSAGMSDASITYTALRGADSKLLVCRNWSADGSTCGSGTGWIQSGQNSQSALGWPDTDGYYHYSNACTSTATMTWGLEITYWFYQRGWIKTSGWWGYAWRVSMWCS